MKVIWLNPNETPYQKAKREREAAIRKANFEKKIGYVRKEVKKDEK